MNDGEVKSTVIPFAVFTAWRNVMGFHDLVALQGFQMNVEAPQAMQVFEHLVGGVAQRFAVVLLMAQGQRAVAAAVDAVDLHVRFAIAEVVLRSEGFANDSVAAFVMDRRYQQIVLLIVIENAEQFQVADHLR